MGASPKDGNISKYQNGLELHHIIDNIHCRELFANGNSASKERFSK
ncbi:hypothetical protein [Candidatus Nitrosocosmicus sp. T]